jgi:putative hydrolase of the HAD superfamily
MKYKAVIFDLFGTLVYNLPYKEYQNVLGQMASILTLSSDDFRRLWYETTYERNTGVIRTIEANIKYICEKLGTKADDTKVRLATKIRYDFVVNTMRPRQHAIDVLSYLKSQGLKTGLISNCSPDTPLIWKDTPFVSLFDVALFSGVVGLMKPDPRIYQIAFERLAVKPKECLYIADGMDQELASASKLGMHAILIRVPNDSDYDPYREEWHGPVISSLKEALTLVR